MKTLGVSKYIFEKMKDSEKKKLQSMYDKEEKLFNEMLKHQAMYVEKSKKNENDPKLKQYADKGFKYEFLTFEMNDKINEYKKTLKNKYPVKK
jgi:predicted NUDIX family phosphoesterase